MKDEEKPVTVELGWNSNLTLLFLLFLGLKLAGAIKWSWLFVFMPLIIPPAIMILAVGVFFIGDIIDMALGKFKKAKKNVR